MKRFISFLCITAMLFAGLYFAPAKEVSAEVSTDTWLSAIAIDFGTTTSNRATNILMPATIPETEGVITNIVQGYGQMDYSGVTLNNLLQSAEIGLDQHVGFNKLLPAAVNDAGGDYYKDWVFSPNGEPYTFSIDLIPGQYYVYVYTGNKTREYSNTTKVSFNDELSQGVVYDQTSNKGMQFWGPTKTEVVYIVDVADKGGYGTLSLTLFDDTIGDPAYEDSHKILYENAIDSGVAEIETDYGWVGTINMDLSDVFTARFNGIEICPVANPVHSTKISAPASLTVEKTSTSVPDYKIDLGVNNSTGRIYYTSTDTSVATVDCYSGAITPVETGTTTIKAYDAYLKKWAETELKVIPERTISLDKTSADIKITGSEDSAKATLKAKFNEANSDVIEWSVSDSTILSLGTPKFTAGSEAASEITVTALKPGTATVTAKRKDNTSKTASCSFTVTKQVSSVAINDADNNPVSNDTRITIKAGESYNINTVVLPEDATNKKLVFTSSDTSVATVEGTDTGAKITGVKEGEAIITATSDDNRDAESAIAVTITAPDPTPTPTPDATPTPGGDQTKVPDNKVAPPTGTPNDQGTVSGNAEGKEIKITLSGKKKATVIVKKSLTFKAKAANTKIKKLSFKIKKGKKFVSIKVKKKKKFTIKGKKAGSVKVVFTIKTADGSKKFTRTIKVK